MSEQDNFGGYGIAIVGMATRVPGASNPDEFWHNLRNGTESVQFYSDEELLARGVRPEQLKNPHYVKAGAPLDKMEYFDPDFFGFSPKEAAILDPQHRQFYECCWEALERAGHVPSRFDGAIGVFAGCGMGAYFAQNLITNPDLVESVGMFLLRHTGNDKDFLATRVSYILNLTGPSINVQTACSTSSVATHLACQSLLSEECDMAIAGGVTIEIPHGRGYPYREGEILSPDGHCRPFDHRSKGTIFGSGTGAIVLRRLDDAIADGDHIHGVIIGSAINNDGSNKVGYLAPSVEGQAHAITEALEIADVDADSIAYVECHGTGTPVGDPIELSALTAAFSQTTQRTGYCGVGSVKSNIGHLDTAAGVVGIIKATLAVEKGEIPPSINYEAPNPSIDFVRSPFYVNDKLKIWGSQDVNSDSDQHPRRAAINSLGVGGTNAFIIVEQAPAPTPSSAHGRKNHLIVLSAKNRKSLDAYCDRLALHLKEHPELDLADVAYTLFQGREAFEHRRVLSCASHDEAIQLLESKDQRRVFTHSADHSEKSLVFMFPGGGAQYADMGKGLYDAEPVFKALMDDGFTLLKEKTGLDYKRFLFVDDQDVASVKEALQKPSVQLPLIFLVEYALAKQWISLGIKPNALIGHSMGENTAACLAGVFEFKDALGLVLLRGQLMDKVPEGGMLSVQLPAEELKQHLHDKLALAAINSPMLSVASGTKEDLKALSEKLTSLSIENTTIPIDIAAHSWLLDGMLTPFGDYLRSIKLNKPKVDFISNLTGTWITSEQATDPEYWVKHLRNTVRFADGINTLLAQECIFLEVGPGNTLGSLTRQNTEAPTQRVLSSLRHPKEQMPDLSYFLTVLGRLWAVGYEVQSNKIWPEDKRNKVPLPSYAFMHNPYWIEPGKPAQSAGNEFAALEKLAVWEDWFRKPVWVQQGVLAKPSGPKTWLVFDDDNGIGSNIVEKLRSEGHTVVTVVSGDAYYKISNEEYCISAELGGESYTALVKDLVSSGNFPDTIVHLWLLTREESFRPGSSFLHRNKEKGFYSLFFFARAIADEDLIERELDIIVYTNGSQQVSDEALPYPEKATVLGPCKVLPREFPGLHCHYIDIDIPHIKDDSGFSLAKLTKRNNTGDANSAYNEEVSPAIIDLIHKELFANVEDGVYAYRNNVRWQLQYDHAASEIKTDKVSSRLRQEGVYFITGGLGGIAYVMATELAKQYKAKLVLVNRTPMPARGEWPDWLRSHGMEDAISRNIAKVQALEALGADVLVLSGDVTDIDRMRDIVDDAVSHFGKIHGVMHAAGTVDDGLVQMKSQADMENVFAPKMYGTLVLDELFSGKELDIFVLFSSTSTVIAPVGQIDYVAANAFMNAYAHKRNAQEKGYTCAINWGVWNEVGMAAATAHAQGYGQTSKPEKTVSANYPLFDKHITRSSGGKDTILFTAYLSSQSNWVLDEHRTLDGQALLPGTSYIELARAALHESGEKGSFELKELTFLKALYVPNNETITARVKLQQTTAGYQFSIQSETRDLKGNTGWQTHAEATVLLGAIDASTETLDAVLDRLSLTKTDLKVPAIKTRQEDHLQFGPRWKVLRDAKYGDQEAVARISLADEFTDDQAEYEIHPALLDIASGYAMDLIKGYAKTNADDVSVANKLWVPVSYASFTFYKPLTQQIYSWVRNHTDNTIDRDFASFDVIIYDSRGQVLAQIKELTIKKLTGTVDFSKESAVASVEVEQSSASSPGEFRQLSPAEMAFQHNLSQGILPHEGSKALFAVLNNATATEVIISSLALEGLIKEVDASAALLYKEGSDTKFARPELDNDYVGPRDDIEKTLVGFWEELLGVDQVGIEDSFFDLGGHSLIAVRLFAKIQQVYNADYPISILFEAPTISACSALIRETVGDSAVSGTLSNADDSEQKTHKARYTHLVPMHSAKSSESTPFFLVAGMFGNVLNLRHLAQLIGSDRPFYGIQARGLYGDSTPHETFEEMAKDYITELLTVQSCGPFILGGFSGGGITAFEIAKQLIAMGHEVADVILLDTPLPFNEPLSSVDRMSIHWQRIKSKGAGYFTEWAKSRYQWELQKFRKRFSEADEGKEAHDFQSERMEMAFHEALARYDLTALDIHATLFRPRLDVHYRLGRGRVTNAVRQVIYKDNGWPPYVDQLDVYEVPGNHDSMVLEPNVRVLASKLRQAIEKADPKTRKR
jgi:acyl transferase domain-containing protein/thioesterase domain-containing protein/NAD(P)-dependent dehydrogenase (short-subunit alcohol dehydrogenase family)/acyl carrier protein